jgi:hypothetical protein
MHRIVKVEPILSDGGVAPRLRFCRKVPVLAVALFVCVTLCPGVLSHGQAPAQAATGTSAGRPVWPSSVMSRAGFPSEMAGQEQSTTRWALSFAWYQWFIESGGGGWSWFRTGEYFEGPVHVNGDVRIDGDPWFGGPLTAGGGLTMTQGSDPTFVMGYWLHVDPIDLPTRAELEATLKYAAMGPGGLYAGPLGEYTYYEVELGVPASGYLTYTGYDEDGSVIAPPVAIDLSLLNGAAWFDETIRIWGVLDGQLTIGASNSGANASGSSASIEIMDDIVCAGSTPGSGPDPDCDDMLGLVAAGSPRGDIIIAQTPENMSDCEVHAVMMALEKNIEAEDYQHGPPRGAFTIYGSLLADYAIHLGQFDNDGNLISGYLRDYHYDNRVLEIPPPFFPAIEIETGAQEDSAVSLGPCSPSPFRGSTMIRFTAPPGRPAAIAIYDVSGRLVRAIFKGTPSAGSAEVRWDGRDARGERVASGVYLVRLEADGRTSTRRVALLK